MLSTIEPLFFGADITTRDLPLAGTSKAFGKMNLAAPNPMSRSQSAPVHLSDEQSLNMVMKQLLLKRQLGHATPSEEMELLTLMQCVLKLEEEDSMVTEVEPSQDFNILGYLDGEKGGDLGVVPGSTPPRTARVDNLPVNVFRADPIPDLYADEKNSFSSPSSPLSPLYSSPPISPSSWASEQFNTMGSSSHKNEDAWDRRDEDMLWSQRDECSSWVRRDERTLWGMDVESDSRPTPPIPSSLASRSFSAPPSKSSAEQRRQEQIQNQNQNFSTNVSLLRHSMARDARHFSNPTRSPSPDLSEDGSDIDGQEETEDEPAPSPPPPSSSFLQQSKPQPTLKPVTAIQKPRRRRKHAALFGCPYPDCGQSFPTRFSLKRHQKRHTGERPFQCDIPGCNRRFAEKSTLDRHRRSAAHTGATAQQNMINGFTGVTGMRRVPNEKAGSPKRRKTSLKDRLSHQNSDSGFAVEALSSYRRARSGSS